jgi:hypothetical protein
LCTDIQSFTFIRSASFCVCVCVRACVRARVRVRVRVCGGGWVGGGGGWLCGCGFRIVFTALENPLQRFLLKSDNLFTFILTSSTLHFPSPISDRPGQNFHFSNSSLWFGQCLGVRLLNFSFLPPISDPLPPGIIF